MANRRVSFLLEWLRLTWKGLKSLLCEDFWRGGRSLEGREARVIVASCCLAAVKSWNGIGSSSLLLSGSFSGWHAFGLSRKADDDNFFTTIATLPLCHYYFDLRFVMMSGVVKGKERQLCDTMMPCISDPYAKHYFRILHVGWLSCYVAHYYQHHLQGALLLSALKAAVTPCREAIEWVCLQRCIKLPESHTGSSLPHMGHAILPCNRAWKELLIKMWQRVDTAISKESNICYRTEINLT